MITKQLPTPLQLAPPLPPDTTPESAKVYWYFKRGGPKSWCKGAMKDCYTGARCLSGAILHVYGSRECPTIMGDKLRKTQDALPEFGFGCIPEWNDWPSTTFEDVLNLTKKLEI